VAESTQAKRGWGAPLPYFGSQSLLCNGLRSGPGLVQVRAGPGGLVGLRMSKMERESGFACGWEVLRCSHDTLAPTLYFTLACQGLAVGMYGPPSDCKLNLCGECFGSAQMYPACLWSFCSWPQWSPRVAGLQSGSNSKGFSFPHRLEQRRLRPFTHTSICLANLRGKLFVGGVEKCGIAKRFPSSYGERLFQASG
jgi:hypothetical protein